MSDIMINICESEGFHYALNQAVLVRHPSVYRPIQVLQDIEAANQRTMAQLALGAPPKNENKSMLRLMKPCPTQPRVSVRIRSICGTMLWPKFGFRMWATIQLITGPVPRRNIWAITGFPHPAQIWNIDMAQVRFPHVGHHTVDHGSGSAP